MGYEGSFKLGEGAGAGVIAWQHNGQWSSWVPGLGRAYRPPPYVYVCTQTHTHMRHRRTQFIIKYLAYFAARLRASAYYNNISGQLPAWLQLETRVHEPYDNNNNAMGRRGRGRGSGRGRGRGRGRESPNENASCPALGSVNVP